MGYSSRLIYTSAFPAPGNEYEPGIVHRTQRHRIPPLSFVGQNFQDLIPLAWPSLVLLSNACSRLPLSIPTYGTFIRGRGTPASLRKKAERPSGYLHNPGVSDFTGSWWRYRICSSRYALCQISHTFPMGPHLQNRDPFHELCTCPALPGICHHMAD
jgi:hypothetical protein